MKKPAQTNPLPDYGIDAPGIVRNLLVGGSIALLVSLVCGFSPRTEMTRSLMRLGVGMTIGCFGMGSS